MKVAVLGAGGMAGHMLTLRLAELGHDVTGIARRPLTYCKNVLLDVRDETALALSLSDERYDAVINAVGKLVQASSESPSDAIWVNSYFPHYLAKLATENGFRVVHLSTDCVFDGKKGGYDENAKPDATDWYGRTKAMGELTEEGHLTIRTSIVGPDINPNGVGLFHWFMSQAGFVYGYANAMWSGVTTLTLANAIHAALEQKISGLINLTNGKPISKLELLRLFNDLRTDPVEIEASDGHAVDKTLKSGRKDFSFSVPDYQEMVREMGDWIRAHHELYPQYRLAEAK